MGLIWCEQVSMLIIAFQVIVSCTPVGSRPPGKSGKLFFFLISQPKPMLWVLKRTVSMRGLF